MSAVNYSTALMRQVQLYKITFNFTHEKNLIVISTFNRLVNQDECQEEVSRSQSPDSSQSSSPNTN